MLGQAFALRSKYLALASKNVALYHLAFLISVNVTTELDSKS